MRNEKGQFIKGYHYSFKTEFKKGQPSPRKGIKSGPLSPEHRKSISSKLKGRIFSAEQRKNMSEARKGYIFSDKHKNNISKSKKGKYRGSESWSWKGGKKTDNDGYVLIYSPHHPFKKRDRYVLEHRLVMEKHLKRFLSEKEVVHHINKIPNDNRIENLMLFPNNVEHIKYHRLNS
jgi:Fe-S cluster biosynthesis and repair protein YggX